LTERGQIGKNKFWSRGGRILPSHRCPQKLRCDQIRVEPKVGISNIQLKKHWPAAQERGRDSDKGSVNEAPKKLLHPPYLFQVRKMRKTHKNRTRKGIGQTCTVEITWKRRTKRQDAEGRKGGVAKTLDEVPGKVKKKGGCQL